MPRLRTYAATVAKAKDVIKGDPFLMKLCVLQPSAFLKQSQETRHALLRNAAEVMLLRAQQDILRSEAFEGKNATPNDNISFGTRWDKVFNTSNDAGAVVVKLPAAALAALQIGIAVQVKPQAVVKPISTDVTSL
jgi:hypothetical protein